jgi:hypothetical protein
LSSLLKTLVKPLLKRAGFTALNTRDYYSSDGLFTPHQPRFLRNSRFGRAYQRGIDASHGIDPNLQWRVHVALWAASRALEAQGDFVECGVNAGFISSAILDYLDWESTGRKFFLVDTFAGPPLAQYSSEEIQQGRDRVAREAVASGGYVTDLERIRSNFSPWPNAVVMQGAVPGVLPQLRLAQAAFLHLDLNSAPPECAALEFFWPLLSARGIILLDDYAYWKSSTQGDALDAVVSRLGFEILSLPTGQGLILK